MKKVILWVVRFVYKYSGLKWVVFEIGCFVAAYRLRLRMVPVSYKLFVLMVGIVIGGSGVFIHNEYPNIVQSNSIIIENTRVIEKAEAKEAEQVETPKVDRVKELSELIYKRESSEGINNYSKCEAVGKYNGVGYGIPGDGSYRCYDSHEDEMQVLRGWIIDKKALGWSELKMLCTYSGNNYKECK